MTRWIFTFLLLIVSVTARADIAVEFECTIPAGSGFDCNMLKQRFFKENALPFVKEKGRSGKPAHTIKVSVGRLPVMNGYNYVTTVEGQEKDAGSNFKTETFVSDGMSPVSALQEENSVLQQSVLLFAKASGEAKVVEGQAQMSFEDPDGSNPSKPKAGNDGRWVLVPYGTGNVSKYAGLPSTVNLSGGTYFGYSGDRDRLVLYGTGSVSQTSVPVPVGDSSVLVPVKNYSASGTVTLIHGMDKNNHFNFGLSGTAKTSPLTNVDGSVGTAVGVEYNPFPFLGKESKSAAIGCGIGPTYYDFDRPNLLEKQGILVINQSCKIAGTLLLDKKRGTLVTASLTENWIVNHPEYVSATASLGMTLKLTDRLSVVPNFGLTWKTKSITTASPTSAPSLAGLSPDKVAEEEMKFQSQASSTSTFGVSGDLMLSYTFGDGNNRDAQDQRGKAIP